MILCRMNVSFQQFLNSSEDICDVCKKTGFVTNVYFSKIHPQVPFFPPLRGYARNSDDSYVKLCNLCNLFFMGQWRVHEQKKVPEDNRKYFTKKPASSLLTTVENSIASVESVETLHNMLVCTFCKSSYLSDESINDKRILPDLKCHPDVCYRCKLAISLKHTEEKCELCHDKVVQGKKTTVYADKVCDASDIPYFPFIKDKILKNTADVCPKCDHMLKAQWHMYEMHGKAQNERIYKLPLNETMLTEAKQSGVSHLLDVVPLANTSFQIVSQPGEYCSHSPKQTPNTISNAVLGHLLDSNLQSSSNSFLYNFLSKSSVVPIKDLTSTFGKMDNSSGITSVECSPKNIVTRRNSFNAAPSVYQRKHSIAAEPSPNDPYDPAKNLFLAAALGDPLRPISREKWCPNSNVEQFSSPVYYNDNDYIPLDLSVTTADGRIKECQPKDSDDFFLEICENEQNADMSHQSPSRGHDMSAAGIHAEQLLWPKGKKKRVTRNTMELVDDRDIQT